MVERNGALERLSKFFQQRKSIMTHIIDEKYVLEIPFRITFLHSLFRVQKLTARVHRNNCLIFYLQHSPQEASKNYRRGDKKQLWKRSLPDVLQEDLQCEGPSTIVTMF